MNCILSCLQGGTLSKFLPGDGLAVTGDPEKMARVFNNLLKNAAAYSYPDTEISISAERKGQNAVVVFRNHGQTIPEDKLVHIFEKFSRLDEARLSDTGGAWPFYCKGDHQPAWRWDNGTEQWGNSYIYNYTAGIVTLAGLLLVLAAAAC